MALGVALGNVAIGAAIGSGVGILFGISFSQQQKAAQNEGEKVIDDGNDKD